MERRWAGRLCTLCDFLRFDAYTPLGSGKCFDCIIYSGTPACGSYRNTEIKIREDVSPYPSILLDLAKWERLRMLSNPTFIAFCEATLQAYVFDLSKAQPWVKTKFVSTPRDYEFPDGPRDLVECVQFGKRQADHIIALKNLSPKWKTT